MGNQLTVQILKGGQPVGSQVFDSDTNRTIKIGRLPSAQLKLDDPKVSRIHAVIEFSGADVSLIDMGSTVGTAVNGAKIHKVKLKHGDQVLLGDTQLVISMGALLPATAAGPGASAPAAAMPGFAPPTVPGAMPPVMPFTMPPGMQAVAAGTAFPARAPVASGAQPRFDPGTSAPVPVRRIGQERLRDAAVENRPHPGLAPEDAVRADNRVLEMRYYWGEVLLDVFHFVKPKRITIGENKECTVFLTGEGLPTESFPLIRFLNNEYVLTFTNQMEGEVELGGTVHKFETLRGSAMAQRDDSLQSSYKVRLATDARVVLHWGGATFALRFVAPPQALPNPMFKNVDLGYLNMLVMLVVFHIAVAVTFEVYPYDTEELREDLFNDPNRFASIILEPPKKDQSTQDLLKKIQQTVEKKVEEQKEKKPEKVVEQKTKIVVNVKAPVIKPQKTQEQKRQEVAQKFSQLFTGGSGGAAGSLLGGGGGGSLSGTLSNVIGTAGRGSATAGLAGLGIRGGLLTGGGVGTSRGIAGIGTAGRLGGGGMGYGSGIGMGDRRDHGVISLSTPVIMGALPKDVILKVIKDNANQIRYCYEIELQKNQNLEGRVQIKWVIGATGEVVKVQVNQTTLKNDAVETCMMNKIKGWKFPAPAGGGIVEVVYPWVLKAS